MTIQRYTAQIVPMMLSLFLLTGTITQAKSPPWEDPIYNHTRTAWEDYPSSRFQITENQRKTLHNTLRQKEQIELQKRVFHPRNLDFNGNGRLDQYEVVFRLLRKRFDLTSKVSDRLNLLAENRWKELPMDQILPYSLPLSSDHPEKMSGLEVALVESQKFLERYRQQEPGKSTRVHLQWDTNNDDRITGMERLRMARFYEDKPLQQFYLKLFRHSSILVSARGNVDASSFSFYPLSIKSRLDAVDVLSVALRLKYHQSFVRKLVSWLEASDQNGNGILDTKEEEEILLRKIKQRALDQNEDGAVDPEEKTRAIENERKTISEKFDQNNGTSGEGGIAYTSGGGASSSGTPGDNSGGSSPEQDEENGNTGVEEASDNGNSVGVVKSVAIVGKESSEDSENADENSSGSDSSGEGSDPGPSGDTSAGSSPGDETKETSGDQDHKTGNGGNGGTSAGGNNTSGGDTGAIVSPENGGKNGDTGLGDSSENGNSGGAGDTGVSSGNGSLGKPGNAGEEPSGSGSSGEGSDPGPSGDTSAGSSPGDETKETSGDQDHKTGNGGNGGTSAGGNNTSGGDTGAIVSPENGGKNGDTGLGDSSENGNSGGAGDTGVSSGKSGNTGGNSSGSNSSDDDSGNGTSGGPGNTEGSSGNGSSGSPGNTGGNSSESDSSGDDPDHETSVDPSDNSSTDDNNNENGSQVDMPGDEYNEEATDDDNMNSGGETVVEEPTENGDENEDNATDNNNSEESDDTDANTEDPSLENPEYDGEEPSESDPSADDPGNETSADPNPGSSAGDENNGSNGNQGDNTGDGGNSYTGSPPNYSGNIYKRRWREHQTTAKERSDPESYPDVDCKDHPCRGNCGKCASGRPFNDVLGEIMRELRGNDPSETNPGPEGFLFPQGENGIGQVMKEVQKYIQNLLPPEANSGPANDPFSISPSTEE